MSKFVKFLETYWGNLKGERKSSKVRIVTKYTLTKFDIFESYIKNTSLIFAKCILPA